MRSNEFTTINKILSYYSDPDFTIALFPALFHLFNPKKGMKCIMFFCFAGFFTQIINLAYSEPRPYWVYSNIDVLKPEFFHCERGYGCPPLH
jgi:hypothetical protein